MAEPTGLAALYEESPQVRRYVDDTRMSSGLAARNINANGFTTSERAVNRLRARLTLHQDGEAPRTPTQQDSVPKGSARVTPDTVTFQGVVIDENLLGEKDWSRIFQIFNLDPANFEIVGDTVDIGTWQQSKGLDDGTRSTIQLWSHSAKFKKRSDSALPADVVERWRTSLIEEVFDVGAVRGKGNYVMEIADPQLGKKGTAEAVENWKRGVRAHIDEARTVHDDQPLEGIHVAWMGDETEGVANNYTNQPHTIELNQSQQLELDFDLRMWTLREVLDLGLPVSASSVISNHGEWTRNGSKDPVTTKNDNASTHIARQVKKAFDSLHPFGVPKIEWTIGDSSPGVIVNLSGIDCYFSHAYVEKGKGPSVETRTKDAIQKQILGDIERFRKTRLFFTAHYHHLYMQEFEGKTLFGAPALEALRSSEYMQHQFGVWSPPGMTGLIVGRDVARGWSNLNVF